MSADQRVDLAAEYLADATQRPVDQLPPSLLMRECADLRRLLGQVLGVLADRIAERHEEARKLTEIRAVLAGFDWAHHDRQLALEEIERIAIGDPNGGP